jgi:hypothetical protein
MATIIKTTAVIPMLATSNNQVYGSKRCLFSVEKIFNKRKMIWVAILTKVAAIAYFPICLAV